jgi:exodeoxyribonuclease V alpha subunit
LLHVSDAQSAWKPVWLEQAARGYGWIADALKNKLSPLEILQQQTQFQLLSALREGPYGVDGINRLIAEKLNHNLDAWYAGQPVMITQNDHNRKLYNGDVGMVLEYEGQLKACFIVNNTIKAISRAQMPAYETCYAITVHKSQGSEYERVMIVLPADTEVARANPVLTRELVYTAITRAKSQIDLWVGEGVLEVVAQKTTQRMSGLSQMYALCKEEQTASHNG